MVEGLKNSSHRTYPILLQPFSNPVEVEAVDALEVEVVDGPLLVELVDPPVVVVACVVVVDGATGWLISKTVTLSKLKVLKIGD